MSTARPADFESEGQYSAANVNGSMVVNLFNDDSGIAARQIDADRVLVGGGYPDEAIEMESRTDRNRADFGAVDACVRHDDGDVIVWLAP